MKKSLLVGATVLFTVFGIFSFAGAQAVNVPTLGQIWSAILQLRNAVANIQLTPGPQGVAGPQGPQGIPGQQLHLYDANNQDLGVLVNSDPDYVGRKFTSYLSQEEIFLKFEHQYSNSLGFSVNLPPSGGSVKYSQLNCQGQAFTSFPGYVRGAFFVNSNGAHHLFKYIYVSNVSYASTLSELAPSGCVNSANTDTSYPIQEVPLPFTEPLVYPLHIQ